MMRSRGWNRRAKLYFSLTIILIIAAWTYTWFSREVPLHHHLLVPFSFVTLGMAIKYGDQVFDLNIGSKRNFFQKRAEFIIIFNFGFVIFLRYSNEFFDVFPSHFSLRSLIQKHFFIAAFLENFFNKISQ